MEDKFECFLENDAVLDTIYAAVKANEGYPRLIIPQRYREMLLAKDVIDSLLSQNGCGESNLKLEPTFCMGSIVAEVDELVVRDPVPLIMALSLASNFEIYPLTNGKMRLAFTFNQLMKIMNERSV